MRRGIEAEGGADEAQLMFSRAEAAVVSARKILAAIRTLANARSLTAGTCRAGFSRFMELTGEAQGLIEVLGARAFEQEGVER